MSQEEGKTLLFTRKNKREMSSFLGQELLYDYLTHQLDSSRKQSVEEFIKESKEAQQDLIKMMNGIQYSERLSETVISEPIIEKINEPSNYMAVLLRKTNFSNWPLSFRWGLEALLVSAIVVLILVLAPWEKAVRNNWFSEDSHLTLAEVEHQKQSSAEKLKELEKTETPQFDDEELKPEVTQAKKSDTSKDPVKPVSGTTRAGSAVATAPTAEENKKVAEGFLYRGVLDATNLEMVGPKIKDKIIELGGRKAGEVELGWQKTAGSAYFHFTIPEAKYQDLNAFLNTYGKINLIKEKHPRIMPDGIIRLIITVNEAEK